MAAGAYTSKRKPSKQKYSLMSTCRTHITLPKEILTDLDRLVEKRSRSRFIAEAVRNALLIARQKEALRNAVGSWKDKDHPELKAGTAEWVGKLRRESEERFKKQFRK
jgi:Arc/MetJ-type ribon-helix-helix transcriptional regulator